MTHEKSKKLESEKLRKLEAELADLSKIFERDLIPKREKEKHRLELENLKLKIEEERKRLLYLKESGEVEESLQMRRPQKFQNYDPRSMPDIGFEDEQTEVSYIEDVSYEDDPSTLWVEEDILDEGGSDRSSSDEDDGDAFSEANRWKRARQMADPDYQDW